MLPAPVLPGDSAKSLRSTPVTSSLNVTSKTRVRSDVVASAGSLLTIDVTVGGVLALPVRVTVRARQLLPFSNTESPGAFTLTVYESLSASVEFIMSRLPSISKWPESASEAIPYTGPWPSSTAFCAEMVPTVPGTSALSMDVLFIVTYQLPRFWSKSEAPENMPSMLVTDETSQSLRGWLKEEAP